MAYSFYVGWGIFLLLLVVMMVEGSVLGFLASRPLMPSVLAALALLVVVMWSISVVASLRSRDLRLAVLWGGTVVYAAVAGIVPFWATLVYGICCCVVAAHWLTTIRSAKIDHVPWA